MADDLIPRMTSQTDHLQNPRLDGLHPHARSRAETHGDGQLGAGAQSRVHSADRAYPSPLPSPYFHFIFPSSSITQRATDRPSVSTCLNTTGHSRPPPPDPPPHQRISPPRQSPSTHSSTHSLRKPGSIICVRVRIDIWDFDSPPAGQNEWE